MESDTAQTAKHYLTLARNNCPSPVHSLNLKHKGEEMRCYTCEHAAQLLQAQVDPLEAERDQQARWLKEERFQHAKTKRLYAETEWNAIIETQATQLATLESQVEPLKEYKRLIDGPNALRLLSDYKKMRDENDALVEVLRRMEWRGLETSYGPDMIRLCPDCQHGKQFGHADNCGLDAALHARGPDDAD